MMKDYYRYPDQFDRERNLAFKRSRCQARFRGEVWTLTFEEFCTFWSTEELWDQRGRHEPDLVLTRFDVEKPWDKINCCIITRGDQLRAKIERRQGRTDLEYFKDAIWYAR